MLELLQRTVAVVAALELQLKAVLQEVVVAALQQHSQGACMVGAEAGLCLAVLQLLVAAVVPQLELLGVLQLPARGSVPVLVQHPVQVSSLVGADWLEGMSQVQAGLDIVWMLFRSHCLAFLLLSHTAADDNNSVHVCIELNSR